MIAVPPQFRSLLVYLESSIHPVSSPRSYGIFHPKVWYIRYRHTDTNAMSFRLLNLSRNLTFDRSWDTVLRLDGVQRDGVHRPELARFTQSLLRMASHTRPVDSKRAEDILELGNQLSTVDWVLPDGFEDVAFWPLGDDGVSCSPFESVKWRRDRMLMIAPFVTSDTLHRLTKQRKGSILISRPETLDALGQQAVAHLAERLVLSADAWIADEEDPGSEVDVGEGTSEISGLHTNRLEGLHAKTYVFDAGWNAHVWTGSANATDVAFNGNVEFMVQLIGKKNRCGVQAFIGDDNDHLGLRKIVEPYDPPNDDPLELTDKEEAQRSLESLRRTIGGLSFKAVCTPLDQGRWKVDLTGKPGPPRKFPEMARSVEIGIRPLTLGLGEAMNPSVDESCLNAVFHVSEQAVTPFFAITLSTEGVDVSFVVAAELENPPEGREEQVLTDLLRNRTEFIRLLLLLLGDIDGAMSYLDEGSGKGSATGSWQSSFASEALLEPLMRSFARNPGRLFDIEKLLSDLQRSPQGESVVPERWDEIWLPILAALAERDADAT